MEENTGKKMYCPICNGPVEETGKPAWAYCPTHGWVKYKSRYEKESEDLAEKLSSKGESLAGPEEKEITSTEKRFSLMRYIVPAIAVTVLLGLLVGYFFWRDRTSKNEQLVELHSQIPGTMKEASPNKEEKKEMEAERTSESRKSGRAKQFSQTRRAAHTQKVKRSSTKVFTVQAGAFREASHAESLKAMLHKKGYVATIVSSKSKERGTLHKVFVGAFKEKKKAENLSREIGKQEGIQTFVRVK